jgi:hypothetical protein
MLALDPFRKALADEKAAAEHFNLDRRFLS